MLGRRNFLHLSFSHTTPLSLSLSLSKYMEIQITYKPFPLLVCAVILSICAWSVLNWVWLRPKRLERFLRKQGLHGNSYRLLYGDMKELSTMTQEAHSRPINLSDDIVPRVIPFFHKSAITHGTSCNHCFMRTFLWGISSNTKCAWSVTIHYRFIAQSSLPAW